MVQKPMALSSDRMASCPVLAWPQKQPLVGFLVLSERAYKCTCVCGCTFTLTHSLNGSIHIDYSALAFFKNISWFSCAAGTRRSLAASNKGEDTHLGPGQRSPGSLPSKIRPLGSRDMYEKVQEAQSESVSDWKQSKCSSTGNG